MRTAKLVLLFSTIVLAACSENLHNDSTSNESLRWDFGVTENHHRDYLKPGDDKVLSLVKQSPARIFSSVSVRDQMTNDGLEDGCILFKVDNNEPSRLILTLDVGIQDQISTEIKLDEMIVQHHWSTFRTPSEAREKDKNNTYYAVLSLVKPHSHAIELCNQTQNVRLLGAHLFTEKAISSALTVLGNNEPRFSLKEDYFLNLANSLKAEQPNNDFTYFMADLMSCAEDFTQKMGWEWASEETGLGIFDRYHQVVLIWDALIQFVPAESPWQDRFRFERARLLMWLWREQHGESERIQYQQDIVYLAGKYPQIKRIQMYAGVEIPNEFNSGVVVDQNAPDWSQLQLQVVHELKDIAHWWVNVRQAENGELGGKLGDDVELMRWWPMLTALDDKTTIAGWEKLANAVWNHKKVTKGYSTKARDVEHASEFISDTAPMMSYFSNADWKKQMEYSREHFKLWTAKDKDGDIFFRSAWYSYNKVDETPPRNRDLDMNARAMKPLRFLAVTQQDEIARAQVLAWAKSWAKLASMQDKGKPVGVFPASYRVSDSQINGDQENWYQADILWPYFEWEISPGIKLYQHLLIAHLLSGDAAMLQPMKDALNLVKTYTNAASIGEKGSAQWAAKVLAARNSFWDAAGEWRRLSGDETYDDLIMEYASSYTRYMLNNDTAGLSASLNALLHGVTHNRPLQQAEVLFTDRLYFGKSKKKLYPMLYAMLTGDISGGNNPFSHVTWRQPPEGFTTLVSADGKGWVQARIYIHRQKDAQSVYKIGVRPWRIGTDNVHFLLSSGDKELFEGVKKMEKPGQTIWFEMEAGRKYILNLSSQN